MSRIRRAFLMSSLEQYLALVVNLGMVAVLARLLTPAEIGIAVVGMGISAVVFSLREFASPEFLIKNRELDRGDVGTALTILMALTLALAAGLYAAAEPLGRFYGEPGLQRFLIVALMAACIESSALPAITLLRRQMSFGTLARIRTAASVIVALTTIGLAWAGFSYMSYAWGMLAGAAVAAILARGAAHAPQALRPSVRSWRALFSFGCYRGATTVIEKAYETLPQMVLGHIMPMSAVGYYNRANAICGIPDRLLLSPIFAVAFPALAAHMREGEDVKQAYLRLLSFISVVYWPALTVLALTADAVVHVILGRNWEEVIPLVRILALAALFWFPVIPTNPMLLAMGRNRDAFLASLSARSAAAVILCSASVYGLTAMAASQFVALPIQMAVALHYARKYVLFTWRELADAICPSAFVTLCATAGPLVVTLIDGRLEYTAVEFGLATLSAGAGWFAGLHLAHHPLLTELLTPLRGAYALVLVHLFRRSATPAE